MLVAECVCVCVCVLAETENGILSWMAEHMREREREDYA